MSRIHTVKKKLEILIVDDEPENVEPLEACFKQSKIRFCTVNSLEEAAERLRRRTEIPYCTIILDNHFIDDSGVYPEGIVDGVDFANIVAGNRAVFTPVYLRFIDEHFGKKYKRVINAYADKPLIIFSGSAATERLNRPDLFTHRNIAIVTKMADNLRGSPCEEDIVDILGDYGIHFKPFDFKDYKVRNSLTDGVRDYA